MSRPALPATDFWNFSVALYRQPGVAQACLRLQDGHGFDVSLLLFCVWYGREHGLMSHTLLRSAMARSSAWNGAMVRPLRDIRTRMKGNRALAAGIGDSELQGLREQVKSLELAAEKLQQRALHALAEGTSPAGSGRDSLEDCQRNLHLLCTSMARPVGSTARALLQSLAAASRELPVTSGSVGQAVPGS